MADTLQIVIDTREQTPLSFSGLPDVEAISGTLQSGDYSLAGFEEHFAVERKSIEDLVGSLTGDRDRFKRELHRLRGFSFARLVIVGSMDQISLQRYRSKANPKALLASLTAFEVEYNVPSVFIARPDDAARCVARWAYYFRRSRQKGLMKVDGTCPHDAVKVQNPEVALGVV